MYDGNKTDDFPELPSVLLREASNEAELVMSDQVVETVDEAKPLPKPKAKASGSAKPEKQAKPKAKKAKGKGPVKAKAKAKGSEKSKVAKPKANKEVDIWGLRKGSAKSKAAAMYARKSGATLAEVKDQIGSIQLNVLTDLQENGYVVEKEKQQRGDSRPVFRYWLKPKK